MPHGPAGPVGVHLTPPNHLLDVRLHLPHRLPHRRSADLRPGQQRVYTAMLLVLCVFYLILVVCSVRIKSGTLLKLSQFAAFLILSWLAYSKSSVFATPLNFCSGLRVVNH